MWEEKKRKGKWDFCQFGMLVGCLLGFSKKKMGWDGLGFTRILGDEAGGEKWKKEKEKEKMKMKDERKEAGWWK